MLALSHHRVIEDIFANTALELGKDCGCLDEVPFKLLLLRGSWYYRSGLWFLLGTNSLLRLSFNFFHTGLCWVSGQNFASLSSKTYLNGSFQCFIFICHVVDIARLASSLLLLLSLSFSFLRCLLFLRLLDSSPESVPCHCAF